MLIPVILCGGTGTRLWPLSRNCYPKQLLPLVTENSLLQDTLLRVKDLPLVRSPLVICHEDYRFLVAEQIQEMGITDAKILLEPIAKNTAPAATIAALVSSQTNEDPLLLVLPADHILKGHEKFLAVVQEGIKAADQGYIVTFGIEAKKPETGYGYIKKANKLSDLESYRVEKFVEKPDRITAQQYVNSGEYFWNSGIFLFRASTFLNELHKHAPLMFDVCQKTANDLVTSFDFIRLKFSLFQQCPNDSIDYALMEKTSKAVVVPLSAEWSDVGCWKALWETQASDKDGNVLQGDVIVDRVSNSYLRAESRMLAVVGVNEHIVVETPDAVLVAHKDYSQSVKELVAHLNREQRTEAQLHRKVYRPWGHYETIDTSANFLVKRITVKSGASLSLQMHRCRSEHWVVVKGEAKVTRDQEVFLLKQNESTFIPVGVKHRLENLSDTELEIIEVQCGSYLGEDDIVRFEDVYGRDCAK